MQKGDHMLVILVSNFMPVLSTVISAVLLGVTLTWPMVAGSLMVVAGTLFCKASIKAGDGRGGMMHVTVPFYSILTGPWPIRPRT